jgi:hypothetical protein
MVYQPLPTWNINRKEEKMKEEEEGAPMVICCRSFPLGARSIVKINKKKMKKKKIHGECV